MLLGIDNFDQFKIFFDVIYDITDLLELQLFKDHMKCTILDKAHTRFMSVEFKSDFFSVYEVNDVESVTLFAEDIHKIIKSVNKVDNVVLESNDDYLICRIESDNGNSRVFEFVLPSDFIESPQPPSISLPINLTVGLNDLKQGINDLKIVGSNVMRFTAQKDSLIITAGVDINTNYSLKIPVMIETDDETNYVQDSYSSTFTLDYIEQLLKFNKINKNIELRMGDDYPLLYSVNDEIMGVCVDGLIAPRIEVED